MQIQWNTVWSAISAIGTAVAAGAIIFAWRQLRFDAWLKAQEIWTAPDFTRMRGHIFARLDMGPAEWSEAEEAEARDVCRKMDEFAGLIPFLPKRTVMEIWGVPFANAWSILEPIVKKERDNCWPEKWSAFEGLGRAALQKHSEAKKKRCFS